MRVLLYQENVGLLWKQLPVENKQSQVILKVQNPVHAIGRKFSYIVQNLGVIFYDSILYKKK